MEFGGRYDVTTPDGEKIGVLGKVFGKSLFRSTWRDPGRERAGARRSRRSARCSVAFLRRVIDAVPYGDFVPILFHFTIDAGEQHLGD